MKVSVTADAVHTAAAESLPVAPLMTFVVVVVVSFLLCLIAGMNNDTVIDFFTANRTLSAVGNTLALCGDYIPTTALLGSVGAVALGGHDGMVLALCAVAALGVLVVLAEPLRNTGQFTLGGILESRVQGRTSRIAGAVITLAACLPLLIVQLTVAGDVCAYIIGMDEPGVAKICTILIGTLIISFAAFGGMRGGSMIQILKMIVVFATVLAVSSVVLNRYDWDVGALLEAAARRAGGAASYYSPGRLYGDTTTGRLDLVSWCITVILGAAVFPHLILRVAASRNGRTARRTACNAVVLIAVFYVVTLLVGLSATATLGVPTIVADDIHGDTAVTLLAHALVGGGSGLLFTALACAVFLTALSTVASVTLAASASLAHDLYAKVVRRGDVGELREVMMARTAVMVFGLASVWLAVSLHGWRSTAALGSFAVALTASAVLPALLYSLFWKGFTRTGLLWTLYGSLACCGVLQFFSPSVSGAPYALFTGQDFHWFPLNNVALVTVPAGFLLGWAGSWLGRGRGRRSGAGQDQDQDQDGDAKAQFALLVGETGRQGRHQR